MKKTRRDFLKSAGIGAVAAGAVMGGLPLAQAAEEQFKWKGQAFCTRANRFYDTNEDFEFLIEKYTNGRLQIELHQAGELCPAGQVFDAAGQGIIDFGMGCTCVGKSKAYGGQWFCDAPGSQSPIEKIIWYYNGGGKEILEDIYHKRYHTHPLYMNCVSTEVWIYSNKKINTVADLKGLKMRAAGARGEVLTKMGMSIVVLSEAEMVPALERKVIDAMEYGNLSCTYPVGFCDVVKYLYFHPKKSTSPFMIWAVNLDKWNKLPADMKKAVEKASRDSVLRSLTWNVEQDFLTLKKAAEEKKCEILMLPESVVKAVDEATADYSYEQAKKHKDLAVILESWAKFQKDYGKYARWIDYLNMTGGELGLVKGAS
ncbi:MAG: twin-arginine translocation signal domain-containing protein [Deltaproteobacteria bacterium]|nr:twin-arginine translocation signal domain-containing protein [Deltaproteobacteria bacterium]